MSEVLAVASEVSLVLECDDQPSASGAPSVEEYEADFEAGLLVRRVETREGHDVESIVPIRCSAREVDTEDAHALFDQSWLRGDELPGRFVDRGAITAADLFSGCGGMSVGVREAARALGLKFELVLAVDHDRTAFDVLNTNFPETDFRLNAPIEDLLDSAPGDPLSSAEREVKDRLGRIDLALGGPPCQGHSDLNNHTRRNDPKNALFFKMARFAEVAKPDHLIVENVQGILYDEEDVFRRTLRFLRDRLDYSVGHAVLRAGRLGVAQHRNRVFLVASRKRELDLERMLAPFVTLERDFTWACGDLADRTGRSPFDSSSRVGPVTRGRIDYLFDEDCYELPDSERPPCHRNNEHTYRSVYGRMYPDRPAPTITTGFTSMGQGRFVHPTRRRLITPHEAARLQFFPDGFRFGRLTRNAYKTLIGNAVPPKLTYVLALQLLR